MSSTTAAVESPAIQDSGIDSLIASEPHQSPPSDHLRRCIHRQDSINWILNVHAHYQFHPITAILSINYFDRFLSTLPGNNGWAFQLLSVACLSLAAKMEEPDVPSLLDLQVSEPRFVFEPKTVQRMELWVMARLNWRLRLVTPFDFLHYFIFKISLSSIAKQPNFYSRCSDLIVNTTRVIDFLGFRPSVIAAAAVISAAGEGLDVPESFYEKVNKEMVRSCHQLMEEYLIDTCPSADHQTSKRRRSEPSPASPDAVLDAAACGSCDTHSGNPPPFPGDDDRRVQSPNKRPRLLVQEEH